MAVLPDFLTNRAVFPVDTQKQNYQEISSPGVEPVSLAEAKEFARINTASEDSLISALIVASRIMAEKYTGRAFISRDFELFLDNSPNSSVVEIPVNPLVSVAQISSFNEADTETIFASTNYFVDKVSKPARVILREGKTWPTGLRNANSLRIEFTAGYGTAATDVPEGIRTSVKIIFAKLWELRGQIEDGADTGIASIEKLVGRLPIDAVLLLGPFRIYNL